MHALSLLALAVSVSAIYVPRATPPKGWNAALLENYDTYNTRYLALSCNTKHATTFFDQCCHPLLSTQQLSSRPAQCTPALVAAPAPAPSAPSDNDGDDDLPFCDDDGDDGEPAPAPSPSNAPAVAPVVATPAPKQPAPAPKKPAPAPAPAAAPAHPAAPAPDNSAPDASVQKGGVATFFFQNGNAGACGNFHSDGDFIAAIDADRYGNTGEKSSLCGRKVKITNTNNKKTVTVTIADACPTCLNSNSIDLSTGAFTQIATEEQGEVPIEWSFV